jgi:hypothetical protein
MWGDAGGKFEIRRADKLVSAPFRLGVGEIRTARLRPDGRGFFVATDRWIYSYSLDGTTPHLRWARLLHGTWRGAYRLVLGCDECLEIVLGSDSFSVETVHFNEPNDPPIQGTPKDLLAKWQKVLGLQFDKKMNFFFQY